MVGRSRSLAGRILSLFTETLLLDATTSTIHRSWTGMALMAAAKRACSAGSTGRCLTLSLGGSFPRKLSPFQFLEGRIGLGANPPPQFGQTSCRTPSTQEAQKVHSYEQIRASGDSG